MILSVAGFVTVLVLVCVAIGFVGTDGDPQETAMAATDERTSAATEPAPEATARPEQTWELKPVDKGDAETAQVMCERFVEDELLSPSSAEFYSDQAVDYGLRMFMGSGSVDSENASGTMVRSNFRCYMKYLGDDEWRPKQVNVR